MAAYLKNKAGSVSKNWCAVALANVFKIIQARDKGKFEENAKAELQNKRYADLQEELALAAVEFPPLAPILNRVAEQKS